MIGGLKPPGVAIAKDFTLNNNQVRLMNVARIASLDSME
jgi:hypothetical protein